MTLEIPGMESVDVKSGQSAVGHGLISLLKLNMSEYQG